MKPRILILYTGGTIGMVHSAQGYRPAAGLAERLAQHLSVRAPGALPAYDWVETDQLIDSANLALSDWLAIAHQLRQHWESYDGFVVLHGTDTMAYTAAALSFMFRGMDKPIILTGAQIPLAELRTDALDNVINSLLFAAHPALAEVCICFNGRLLRGNRSTKLKSMALDAFHSPHFPLLAEAGIYLSEYEQCWLGKTEPVFCFHTLNPEAVVIAPVYPGIQAGVLDALLSSGGVRALILQTYGVGNPPDSNQALMDRLAQAHQEGVVIVNLTQCLYGGVYQGAYATGEALNRIGIVAGMDMTLEAAFAKLHCLLAEGLKPAKIRELMAVALRGELTEAANV